MEYNVNPDTKIPMMVTILLAALGLALALTPTFYTGLPSYCFHLPAMVVFTACILILSRFVMTDYTYQLYDAANSMSEYPKLNIYRIRKSGSRMVYCIPFNNIKSVELRPKIKKGPMPSENLCATMFPKNIYCLRYICDDREEEIFLECGKEFAEEIEKRIRVWSTVRPE